MLKREKLRLGDILINQGYLNHEQLMDALKMQKEKKMRLGDYLTSAGIITDTDMIHALYTQTGIEIADLRGVRIAPEIIGLVNGSVLRKHNVLPLSLNSDTNALILAMSDPFDILAQDDVAIVTNCNVDIRLATSAQINAILDRYFGAGETMLAAEEYVRGREPVAQAVVPDTDDVSNAPIVALVRSIIEQAVRQRASDIHFDALEKSVRVRYRIDGVLTEKMVYDIGLLPALITRIKIISGMDISEKRKPQDGRVTLSVHKIDYDMRVSVLPSYYGEKIVMRIANSASMIQSKADLGLRPEQVAIFDRILSKPNGIFLATGPTGSGKSTTLYTALSQLNTEEVNIITAEDPVEANIPGINQVQVNPKSDLTFASALRSILRQDPDIIMIGEIRDQETARMAIQASITGHMVVSTLHTNSASASVTRLLDMGIESFLLADSITGIIAQRLVRKLCPKCKKPHFATVEEKTILGIDSHEDITIYESVGCSHCLDNGYYGRTGVYEIMEVTAQIKEIISNKCSTAEIQNMAISTGMRTLGSNVAQYVLEGVTSISEMLKVAIDSL